VQVSEAVYIQPHSDSLEHVVTLMLHESREQFELTAGS
jgi:hypothetical protein